MSQTIIHGLNSLLVCGSYNNEAISGKSDRYSFDQSRWSNIITKQLKDAVCWNKGINVNFMVMLNRLLQNRPMIYNSPLHTEIIKTTDTAEHVKIYNTGTQSIKCSGTQICLIPVFCRTKETPVIYTNGEILYPYQTVEYGYFTEHFREFIKIMRSVFLNVHDTDDLDDQSLETMHDMACANRNFIWHDLVRAVKESENCSDAVARKDAFDIVRQHWFTLAKYSNNLYLYDHLGTETILYNRMIDWFDKITRQLQHRAQGPTQAAIIAETGKLLTNMHHVVQIENNLQFPVHGKVVWGTSERMQPGCRMGITLINY